jgi:Bacterial pre-peptidase C-terminal domain
MLLATSALLLPLNESNTAQAETRLYQPIAITLNQLLSDTLTDQDIPTGEGGFARDYLVTLQAGDQVSIEANSDNFDTIVTLIAADGSKVAENDDGPDGTSNSLLFSKIVKAGNYTVRLRAFGETALGGFTLKVTRLKPA